ncbi:MAG: hypothetical protein ACKVOH_00440, partial [Chlamydiales bacterium]
MTQYTFADTLAFFGTKLKGTPPKEDVEAGQVELMVDKIRILLKRGRVESELSIEIDIGFFLLKPSPESLRRLVTGNFL